MLASVAYLRCYIKSVVRSVTSVATITTSDGRRSGPPSAVVGTSQLSFHSPVVLLPENPKSDPALD
jgi:hypothetical protein